MFFLPQAHALSSIPEDTGDFIITDPSADADVSFANDLLSINAGSMTISTNNQQTAQRIEVTGAATLTLAGVNIEATDGPALMITDDAPYNVAINVADKSENILTAATAGGCAGLQKNGESDVGTLTISGSTGVNAGQLTATGRLGAGIGGGGQNSASGITINGGIITATGGDRAAGIGGGINGSGSNITINGGTVIATASLPTPHFAFGIGSGNNDSHLQETSSNNITITGGTVKATGFGGIGSDDSLSKLTITGGNVTATGEIGIGAGVLSEVVITGGIVKATGSEYGGINGVISSSGNKLDGNAVLLAESENASYEPISGFDNGLNKGILLTKKGTENWTGEVYGDTVLEDNFSLPTDATLTIPQNNSLTIDANKILTIPDNSLLVNNETVTSYGKIACTDTGKVTTKTDFFLTDGTKYGDKDYYQTYQTSEGVQKYSDLPNPDDPDSSNEVTFIGWYYLDKDGDMIFIDNEKEVLLNQHDFNEYRANVYAIEVGSFENGQILLDSKEVAEGLKGSFEVIPDEGFQLKEGSLKVTANGKEIAVVEKDGKYTFTMPDCDVVITAVFEPIPTPETKEGWDLDDTGWRYFVDNAAITGWRWIDDAYGAHWYFFGDDSYMVSSSWLYDQDAHSWYWVCSTGPMITKLWQWIDNEWYGFYWDGKMCTGWVWDTDWNAWFYCYQNGIMAKSTWIDAYWVDWRGVWLH